MDKFRAGDYAVIELERRGADFEYYPNEKKLHVAGEVLEKVTLLELTEECTRDLIKSHVEGGSPRKKPYVYYEFDRIMKVQINDKNEARIVPAMG